MFSSGGLPILELTDRGSRKDTLVNRPHRVGEWIGRPCERREPSVETVASRVGESLLECSIMTLEKRVCRLAELGPMSRLRESLERYRKSVKNVILFNDLINR